MSCQDFLQYWGLFPPFRILLIAPCIISWVYLIIESVSSCSREISLGHLRPLSHLFSSNLFYFFLSRFPIHSIITAIFFFSVFKTKNKKNKTHNLINSLFTNSKIWLNLCWFILSSVSLDIGSYFLFFTCWLIFILSLTLWIIQCRGCRFCFIL